MMESVEDVTTGMASTSLDAASSDAGSFWAEEKEWQNAVLADPFNITVSDPQTVGGGFASKGYTTYLLVSTPCIDGVRRRYSDFEWLREVLASRYHGQAVPMLPEKKMLNQGDDFIRVRMLGLNVFMRALISDPYIRKDSTLRIFLCVGDAKDFDVHKKAAMDGTDESMTNEGLQRWLSAVDRYSLPAGADGCASEMRKMVDNTEKAMEASVGAAAAYAKAAAAFSEHVGQLHDALGVWQKVTKASAGYLPDNLKESRDSTNALASDLSATEDVTAEFKELTGFHANEVERFLINGISAEIFRLRAMRELLQRRDAAIAACQRAFTAKDKAQFDQKKLREKGKGDKADAMQVKVDESIATYENSKVTVERITKGLLNREASRSAHHRRDAIRKYISQFTALTAASGARQAQLWKNLLARLELDYDATLDAAERTLKGGEDEVEEGAGGGGGGMVDAPVDL
jgi:hypothetical protein